MSGHLRGLPFTKMTGSGNDFVVFDGRAIPLSLITSPEVITSICNRNNGIGADGLVVLEPLGDSGDVRIHFFNSDGSPADLCGNATLCSTFLSAQLGLASASGMRLHTGAGVITSRVTSHSGEAALPELDFQPVTDIRPELPIPLAPGDQRIGFAVAGIPHVVVLCDDAEQANLAERGPALRWHPSTGPRGANVNWVSALPGGSWRYRTFERGVEGETQACGTGAVATAILLARWGLTSGDQVAIRTSSGRELNVRLTAPPGTSEGMSGVLPSLRGEGRVVYHGIIESL
jgi:diaminopimelate epimerase